MIVSFVFTMLTINDYPYLWVFYKFLDFAKRYNYPIIAHESYFQKPSFFQTLGRIESKDKASVDRMWQYEMPKDSDLDLIQKYPIPKGFEDELVSEFGSITDAFKHILLNRHDGFEKLLNEYFDDIKKNNPDDNIEAVLTLNHYPSLSYAAEKYGFRVIHLEQGPWREPMYMKTAYFDFNGIYTNPSSEERYNRFLKEFEEKPFSLLSPKEIMSVLLLSEKIQQIDLMDRLPVYSLGVATGIAGWPLITTTNVDDLELLHHVRQNYSMSDVLVRTHPGDVWKAAHNIPQYSRDDSKNSEEFISKCERIVTLVSNVSVNAMLLGKKVYMLATYPLSFMASKDLSDKSPPDWDIRFVNFFALAYTIPYDFFMDLDYIRWRLTEPSEIDIYSKHLSHYLKEKNIDPQILRYENRLERLLMVQGYKFYDYDEKQDLINQLQQRENEINAIVNSKAWKMTKPLRKIIDWLRK